MPSAARAVKCKEREKKLLIHENHVFLVFLPFGDDFFFRRRLRELSNLQSVLYKVMSCGRQSPSTVVFLTYHKKLRAGNSPCPDIFSQLF